MLEILGDIGSNILSLPGVLGLALGMMTRQLWLGAVMGGVVGIAETLVFAGFQFSRVDTVDLGIAIVVGICAGSLGTVIRLKGATA